MAADKNSSDENTKKSSFNTNGKPSEPEKKEHPSLNAIDQYTTHYPEWAREFARKYFTKTLAEFILFGNVRDLVPTVDDMGIARICLCVIF